MNEVYRARDTRLDRDVAPKVVPEEFISDRQRRALLARGEDTAVVNHPHIAHVYGLEKPRRTPNHTRLLLMSRRWRGPGAANRAHRFRSNERGTRALSTP
jgi:serine/threonine protein kinase